MDFGDYLRTKRKEKDLSLQEVSNDSGVSIAQISRIETGNRGMPKPETIKKLAPALGVTYEELMARAGY